MFLRYIYIYIYSFSVTESCLTLCDPMNCSMLGFPVLHHLLEFAQTHIHWISDAIQPSHPLLPPSLLALNLSQHQCLFQWVGSLHQVAKVLELQPQHQSFQEYSGLISFRIQRSNLCLLHRQVNTLPLSQWGSPENPWVMVKFLAGRSQISQEIQNEGLTSEQEACVLIRLCS